MITIEHSSLFLPGREMMLYSLLPALSLFFVPFVCARVLRGRGVEPPAASQLSILIIAVALLGQMFFDRLPVWMINYAYVGALASLPCALYLLGRLTGKDGTALMKLGILTILLYTVFTRLGCTFAGCCHGAPWTGFPALVYGSDTLCRLPGVPLFPLQPLMALAMAAVAAAACVCVKRGGSLWTLWSLTAVNAALYWLNLALSPMHEQRAAETALLAGICGALALGLMGWRWICPVRKTAQKGK